MRSVLQDKTKVILILIAVTVLAIGLIGLTAYSTSLQYDINAINNRIQDSQWTARNLEVEIKSANTLTSLQEKALDMGLVYPSFDETVYLKTGTQTAQVHDLAVALRENAYNK